MVGAGVIYLTGSLRDDKVPAVAQALRREGIEVHDDWHAAGRTLTTNGSVTRGSSGHTLTEALLGKAARQVFQFDYSNLLKLTQGYL